MAFAPENATKRAESLQRVMEDKDLTIATLKAKDVRAENTITSLSSLVRELKTKLSQVEEKVGHKTTAVTSLNKTVKVQDETIASLNKKILGLEQAQKIGSDYKAEVVHDEEMEEYDLVDDFAKSSI